MDAMLGSGQDALLRRRTSMQPTPSSSSPGHNMARVGVLVLLASSALFGAMAVLARSVSGVVPSAQVATLRFAVGLVGAGAAVLLRPQLFVATRPALLAARGLFGSLSVLGYFYTIQTVSAGMATLLNYTFPVWAAVFSWWLLQEKVTAAGVAGMAVGLTGLCTVVGWEQLMGLWQGSLAAPVALGLVTGFLSSISAGVASTVVRLLRRTDSALAIFLAFCTMGLLTSLPLAWRGWVEVPVALWPALLGIGLLSLVAQVMFTWSLKHVTAVVGGVITQLTVVTSYGLAWLWLDEPVGLRTILGGALVTLGVFLVSRRGGDG